MTDSVDTLSRATGLSRATMLELWDNVKANQAKLTGCARHDFVLIEPAQPMRKRYACSACGGEVDGVAYGWYMEGRRHG